MKKITEFNGNNNRKRRSLVYSFLKGIAFIFEVCERILFIITEMFTIWIAVPLFFYLLFFVDEGLLIALLATITWVMGGEFIILLPRTFFKMASILMNVLTNFIFMNLDIVKTKVERTQIAYKEHKEQKQNKKDAE